MADIKQLIRQDLIDIQPYLSGRDDKKEQVWLDMNESPWDFNEQIVCKGANRYPEPNPYPLVKQLSEYYQVRSDNILITRGSDDGIDILIRLFCRPYQDAILITPPTFVMYEKSAKLQAAKVIEVPLIKNDNFSLDADKIKKSITKDTKIIFICSPNNPTGTTVELEQIINLCQTLESVMIVVDEAYLEYSELKSMSSYLSQYPNLVVLRTLSKAFGLAGIRCGVLMAQAPLIQYLQAMMPPFPLSIYSIAAALKATTPDYIQTIQKQVKIIKEQKERLCQVLRKLPFVTKIWPSSANFVLMEVQDPKQLERLCAEQGIVVKNFSAKPFLNNCIRMSIGTVEENNKLITLLQREITL